MTLLTGRARRRAGQVVLSAALSVVALVMLYPFAFIIQTSFRSRDQWIAGEGYSLASWGTLFQSVPVGQELLHSTIVTLGALAIIVMVSTTAGFAFAKLSYPGSGTVFLAIIAGMMIPVQSMILPEYVNITRLGLVNQYPGAIVVYAALASPLGTYLMTTYFRGVPSELVEAALMDGASYWRIFRSVMLPLGVPAVVTVVVLQFITVWDDFLVGLLFLQTPSVRTITVGLATLQGGRIVSIPAIMAGSLVSALPAVIVYLIFQRQLIAGLTMGMGK